MEVSRNRLLPGMYVLLSHSLCLCWSQNCLLGLSPNLGARSQCSHEELHFVYKVTPFHFVPLDFLERATQVVPFVVLQHITFREIFALAPWELHHDFAATFWTVTYCTRKGNHTVTSTKSSLNKFSF